MDYFRALSSEQVSKILGISIYTIRKLVDKGVLPAVHNRQGLVFNFDALSKWLDEKENEACHA
jgi:excisionase family DNA binding protein